jgi:hypothetical protein
MYTPDHSFPADLPCQLPYLPMNFPDLILCCIRVILDDIIINLVQICLGVR